MKWFVLAVAVVMYAFVIAFQNKKVWFTTLAACIIIATGALFPGTLFPDGGERGGGALVAVLRTALFVSVNWNVILLYIGSMLLAALFIYSRVPRYIANRIVATSPSTAVALVLLLTMTGVISIFVENVAKVLVMAPIALALCRELKVPPTRFLIGLAVMSNLEGTATLVGDPPSMIFAGYAQYTFNDFFMRGGRPSIFFMIQAGLIVGELYFYAFFARHTAAKPILQREKIISVFPAILLLVLIGGLAGISFLHLEYAYLSGLFVFGLGCIGVLWYRFSQKKTWAEVDTLVKNLDWETIGFLAGIFVVVGAIAETSILADFAALLVRVTGENVFWGFLLILIVSVIVSGFVDNVPYIVVMLPVAGTLASALVVHSELYLFALLVGSCLGGNLTPFGASANVVALGILKKENEPVSFGGWLTIAGPFTVLTTAAAALLLWCVWR
ncbi:MAG: citrate transporter [Treponema sp.]|nr:citrate transporter [Treponema sp.]